MAGRPKRPCAICGAPLLAKPGQGWRDELNNDKGPDGHRHNPPPGKRPKALDWSPVR